MGGYMRVVYKRLTYLKGLVGENIYMFTANSTLNKQGKLVMGAGNAKAVRDMYKNIDYQFGKEIKDQEVFGVKFVQYYNLQWIGAFQTKIHWQNESPLHVVENSVKHLKYVAERRPSRTFHLPCPAISHGKRSLQEILPLLEGLPDNVIVYIDK